MDNSVYDGRVLRDSVRCTTIECVSCCSGKDYFHTRKMLQILHLHCCSSQFFVKVELGWKIYRGCDHACTMLL